MHTRLSSLIGLIACVVLLLVPPTRAQETDTTQLPEIAPREFEIRGERQVALPSLERQPLTGFASPPSIPTVPSDHQPYLEPYKQNLEDLPESLPMPETVAAPLQPAPEPASGFVEGGGGRYFTRFLEGRVIEPLSPQETISFHGAYTGTEGFTPFASTSVATPSDVADVRLRLQSQRDLVRIDGDLHASAERYLLYGARPNPGDAIRDGYSAGTSVQIRSVRSVPARAEVAYDRMGYGTDIAAGSAGSQRFHQDRLRVNGSLTAPTTLRPQVEGAYHRSWFGGNPGSGTGYGFDVTGTLTFFETDSTSLEVGATGLGFSTPAQPTTAPSPQARATYVMPSLEAEWRIQEEVTLHLRNQPRRMEASLQQLYAENPYAMHAPSVRPTLATVNSEAGVTLSAGYVRLVAAGGFRYAPTYRYYEPGAQGTYSSGIFQVRHGSARIFEGRVEVALQGVDGVHASLGLSAQDGTLGDGNTTIPNLAPVRATGMLTVSVADGRGFLEAHGTFESARYASRAETSRLDPYFALDLEGSYTVSSDIDVVVRAENLSLNAPTLWAGYPQPPAQISTGLRIRW